MSEKIYLKMLAMVSQDIGLCVQVVTDIPFLSAETQITEDGRLLIVIKHESEPPEELT